MVYRQVTSAADHAILQQDLHKLVRWEAEYSMEFHPHKCNLLRVTRSRSPRMFNYTLHGTTLKSTESTKYLGVTLTKDLTWGKHVDNIRAKANQQLAFIRRNIRTRSSSTKEKLYNTLVRPHIEYAATIWDPNIYHVQTPVTCNNPHTLRDAVTCINRNNIRRCRWLTTQLSSTAIHPRMTTICDISLQCNYQSINGNDAVDSSKRNHTEEQAAPAVQPRPINPPSQQYRDDETGRKL